LRKLFSKTVPCVWMRHTWRRWILDSCWL